VDEQQVVTDAELVILTLQDPNAFGSLVERYEAKLRRYITRLGVLNEDDRRDVMQEIFIKAYRNLNSFDTSLSFSSWIYRIAHNEAISWYRKQSVRPEGHLISEGEDILGLIAGSGDSAEVVYDQTLNAKALEEGLLQIADKYRQVLILRYFEHKEYDEISDILKIPMGSVGTLLHRGKKQLISVLNRATLRI
jgi:RNA polymerase sigma-70 factor, ECF subfamily